MIYGTTRVSFPKCELNANLIDTLNVRRMYKKEECKEKRIKIIHVELLSRNDQAPG